ncbi:hypothetical protein CC1G_00463 [Coprinopsis cinerea okayama7|uniref:Uncharacterized protein n=1 Tax=Coprinopsis cinerea (strain Okayama-7 / 130 / ATCC MYA-4618 / FGSC 9003) TaxID=240176 RepID=A8NY11_COPC7|nr:hypothetical protein CC1G_00463 [Coprinopsis cinerea okayama7\|eukprot:XP_001837327.1 hypothetical protein CC1G_00463 [Coprinopsis cinerea okayama7\
MDSLFLERRYWHLDLVLGFIALVLACAIYFQQQRPSRRGVAPTGHSNRESEKHRNTGDREYGEWQPRRFRYPQITPITTPLEAIKPIPYRPYRPGAYNITMGIKPLPWDEWIELDSDYQRYHDVRKHRIETRRENAIAVLTDEHNSIVRGGALAAIELVHELAAFIAARYPCNFVISRHERQALDDLKPDSITLPQRASSTSRYCDWGWDGACPIKSITCVSSGITYELPLHVEDGDGAPERALEIAALLVQEDLAVMIEGQDGKYYLQAGAVCIPGTWRPKTKFGLPLDEIHTTGDVPRYREKLQASMERFFRRMEVDKAVVRNNYFFQVVRSEEKKSQEQDPEELGWSRTGIGPEEEEFNSTKGGPDLPARPTVDELRFRTERQTLRRLGVSGAIVFTIRTYMTAVRDLVEEKGAAERLLAAVNGWPEDVKEYKGVYRGEWWPVLVEFLTDKKRDEGGHRTDGKRSDAGDFCIS